MQPTAHFGAVAQGGGFSAGTALTLTAKIYRAMFRVGIAVFYNGEAAFNALGVCDRANT